MDCESLLQPLRAPADEEERAQQDAQGGAVAHQPGQGELISPAGILYAVHGDEQENHQQDDPEKGQQPQEQLQAGVGQVAEDAEIRLLYGEKDHGKGQGTQYGGQPEGGPQQLVLNGKMPARRRFGLLFFDLLQEFFGRFHNTRFSGCRSAISRKAFFARLMRVATVPSGIFSTSEISS